MKYFLYAVIAAVLLAIPLTIFYGRYEILSNYLEDELGYRGATANAIKHAQAASQLYDLLQIVFDPEYSKEVTLALGTVNEYLERVTKISKPDPLREIMKDMHNNFAGIIAADWRKNNNRKFTQLDITIAMAEDNLLINSRDQNPFYQGDNIYVENSVGYSAQWLNSHREEMEHRILAGLSRHFQKSNPQQGK